ncbi:MAG: bacteriophage holin [Phycisphaerae bacterium]
MKLNILAFALACGIIWGLGLFVLTWWVIAFEGATGEPTIVGLVYRGYNVSPSGSLIGLLWAAPDGFVGGAIFAWLYNFLVKRIAGAKAE